MSQARVLSGRAGAKAGWSRLTVYEREFRLGHLVCKERGGAQTRARKRDGRWTGWRRRGPSMPAGRCATPVFPGGVDFDRVRSSGGVPGAFVDHQRDAKDFWRRVEQAMGTNDWMICRRVCGENYAVAAAVQAISPGYKFSTLARFREALDALVEAMKRARRELGV